ncbi:MAG: VOC family protein [Acidobacteria bacterium]|nr:VOC family protein [Acidobacteriota bacterium]
MASPVMQFQILSKNPEKSAEFYTQVFGWKIDADNAMGYRMIDTGAGRGIGGGIWPSPPEGHSFVQLFIEVDDVAAHVAKIAAKGGKTIIPPQKLPDGDELAIVHDNEGIPLGLYRPPAKRGGKK